MSFDQEDEEDWEIDSQGLYVATRGFLSRRGYCCGNQCRNCPYINWREQPGWQPVSPDAVQFADVSPKVYRAAKKKLEVHRQRLQDEQERGIKAQVDQRHLINHYSLLLERWEDEQGK